MPVIEPKAFNEPFTIYLNSEGKPVERSLREMTASEVLAAMEWQDVEAKRLEREAEPAKAIAIALAEGRSPINASRPCFDCVDGCRRNARPRGRSVSLVPA